MMNKKKEISNRAVIKNCENKIFNDNCSNIIPSMPDKAFPMILTDIPYNVVNRESAGIRNYDKGIADIETVNLNWLINELSRICFGSIYVFCSTEQVSDIRAGLISKGLSTRLCIWEKTNPSPVNGTRLWLSGIECCVFGRYPKATFHEHCKNTVWRYPNGKSKQHPTEKPVELFKYLISASSNKGDVIFDPFMGSGTTPIAALATGRKYFGIEIDKTFFELSSSRIKKFMGIV